MFFSRMFRPGGVIDPPYDVPRFRAFRPFTRSMEIENARRLAEAIGNAEERAGRCAGSTQKQASHDDPVFSGMTNAELAAAIEAAWQMWYRTPKNSECFADIAAHLAALLEAQRMRASLMVLPAS